MNTSISNIVRAARTTMVATIALSISACSYDPADLRDYVAEVKSRPGVKPQPIHEYPPPERIPTISQKSDPFASFLAEELGKTSSPIDPPEPPWPPHTPEELEHFALDTLRMVGTLEQQSEHWALVRDPAGVIHRVKAGNYVGDNYGKILGVSAQRIRILEKVSDGRGNWEDRAAELALSE